MRLLDLHLKAFGPFTDRRLDLSGGTEGLHVVFGPNEAGKSSALRAIKALLYGFPQRSADNFLHAHEDLRVGGRLRHSDGSEYAFVRRKGTKSTVLAPDESPLDDGFLDRCLQGMEEKLFSSLFGIDHEALIAGGKELLDQHGDVGQALFAAGLGTRSLRKVLQSLDAEANELFLPRGSKPLINRAVGELEETRREVKSTSLSGRDFE
ncbi:MAG TPA: AAA family ATPase, partial [Thermoanaerobaculia bacterium]|nr:AAA family ATPase [Thermoanaerobaculia bacterium]